MGGTVVVGIGSLDLDAAVLDWAADQAWHAHDALYVVHAYRRLVSADRYWPLLVHANDARRNAGGVRPWRAGRRLFAHPSPPVRSGAL